MLEVFENIIEMVEEDITRLNGWEDEFHLGEKIAFEHAIEIVKQAAAEYNNGWIPADEPPKDDNFILLSFENFNIPMVGRYEADREGGGNYYIGDCDEKDTCISNDLFVNAWQPLPEPYKQKGE